VLNNLFRMIKLKSFALGKELITTSDGHTGEEIHEVSMLEQFGFASVPPKGSQGIAFMPNGYSENSVTAFFDAPQYKPTLAEGESTLYDKFGNSVTLKSGLMVITAVNNLNIVVTGSCNLNANSVAITAPTTTVNGNLMVNGSINASGGCDFGGTGGQAIARVGDTVVISGISGVITSGSSNSRSN
jgi:phage gp45-like